ncbi:ABC transporter ATP-binding protein [Aerobium aerolatum]|nr:ATP-binding cassette domain-containing protein [Aquamicrobium aerolatum]
MNDSNQPLLRVVNLKKHFPGPRGRFGAHSAAVKAVDGVDLELRRGETLALVGESGSGKSTLGRAILQLERPSSGQVLFDGVDLVGVPDKGMRRYRRRMQMVFQDPHASLNPRMSVFDIISEPLVIHGLCGSRTERKRRVAELLDMVSLPSSAGDRYPREFSGGQRQRIGIARALAVRPEMIVADEAVSALDVSIQAQIINLLNAVQKELNLAHLFIAHDLSVVHHIADRVAVMYLGKVVEIGTGEAIFKDPRHPYTRLLLQAAPIPDPRIEAERRAAAPTGRGDWRSSYTAEMAAAPLFEVAPGHLVQALPEVVAQAKPYGARP